MSIAETLAQSEQCISKAFSLLASVVESISETEDLQMLTVEETMALLKKSESTIYAMCNDDRLAMVDGRIPRRVVKDYTAGKRMQKGIK